MEWRELLCWGGGENWSVSGGEGKPWNRANQRRSLTHWVRGSVEAIGDTEEEEEERDVGSSFGIDASRTVLIICTDRRFQLDFFFFF